jgi:hypothetical protein
MILLTGYAAKLRVYHILCNFREHEDVRAFEGLIIIKSKIIVTRYLPAPDPTDSLDVHKEVQDYAIW